MLIAYMWNNYIVLRNLVWKVYFEGPLRDFMTVRVEDCYPVTVRRQFTIVQLCNRLSLRNWSGQIISLPSSI